MNIPDKIKIGGLVYSVEQTENITFGHEYGGEIHFKDLKINIRPTSRRRREACFLHEVMHAIFDNLGYKDHDEKELDALSNALYALIVDNPKMFYEKQDELT